MNVVLAPLLWALFLFGGNADWSETLPNFYPFLRSICFINTGLLVFNLLPVYPLDGGQILRSLLWFVFGRARSLLIATYLGFVGAAGLIALAFWMHSVWFGVLTAFILMNCWRGLMQARALARLEKAPRREGFACPVCKTPPLCGPLWLCGKCRKTFDTFETQAVCPHCGAQFAVTACFECGNLRPFAEWRLPVPPPVI